jgi:hypothetical protein
LRESRSLPELMPGSSSISWGWASFFSSPGKRFEISNLKFEILR